MGPVSQATSSVPISETRMSQWTMLRSRRREASSNSEVSIQINRDGDSYSGGPCIKPSVVVHKGRRQHGLEC